MCREVYRMTQPNPLAPLAAYRQFLPVRLVPLANGKTNKIPVSLRGDAINAHDPAYWMSRDEAETVAAGLGAGHTIGFVLTAADPFWCLDMDGCINPDGTYIPLVNELAAQLGRGVAWEQSQSLTGLHLWGRGFLPPHGKKNTALKIELYTDARFIALGTPLGGDMDYEECEGIHAVAHRYFPAGSVSGDAVWEDAPQHPDWVGPVLSDDEVIRILGQLKSPARLFGGKATFQELMRADPTVLAKHFPPSGEGDFDHSSADAALFSDLAWATGHNAVQMMRIARTSGLVRDKWDRDDYIERTMGLCMGAGSRCYRATPSAVIERLAAINMPIGGTQPETRETVIKGGMDAVISMPEIVDISGRTFATRDDQRVLFKDCVYISEDHKALMPNGRMLRPDQFKATMSGFTFMLGGAKDKTTTNAWEAFTEGLETKFKWGDMTCFRPDLPFQTQVDQDNIRYINTYLPPKVRMVEGDHSPLSGHLKLLLPKGDDALMFLSYLAACVQYPGHKFPWAPMLQGVEGNGKTLFSIVTAYAVGKKYTHWPKASKLAKQFNKWMVGKVLYCVEDIYTHGVQGEFVMEELKPMITGGRGLEIEGKGVDQISADVVGNFILNSNFKDGIRKSANDRRYCMLYCAQQEESDLVRDFGDVNAYMNRLYNWLDYEDGLAIYAHYLKHFPIPEKYDPTKGAQRAPRSSAHDEAVEAGLGMVEQLVLEAIDEGRLGFRGGWVSDVQLKLLLEVEGKGRFITPAKRKTIMQSLGYVPHPALNKGRTDNNVLPDGKRTVLYVKTGSAQWGMQKGDGIPKAYTVAQTSM